MDRVPIYQAAGAVAVTPDDDNDLPRTRASLYVGTAGNIVVVMESGETVTFTNIQDGTFMPIRVNRVKATSTTATNIVALYP